MELHVTQGAISQWEKGDTLPRGELLPKLAKLLGCSVDEVLGIESEEQTVEDVGSCEADPTEGSGPVPSERREQAPALQRA